MALGISRLFGRGRGNIVTDNKDPDSYAGTVVPLDNDGETELAVAGFDDTDGAGAILYNGHAGLGANVMQDGSDNITLENYAVGGGATDRALGPAGTDGVMEDVTEVVLNARAETPSPDGLLPYVEQANVYGNNIGGGLLGATGGDTAPDGDAADAVEYGLITAIRGEAAGTGRGFSLPEVEDEVLRQAGPGGDPSNGAHFPHTEGEMSGLISEVGFPAADGIEQDNGGLDPTDEQPEFGPAIGGERGAKWELSEFDAAKNEIAIETLEVAHEGAGAPRATWEFSEGFPARGQVSPEADGVAQVETAIPAITGAQQGSVEVPNLKYETEVVDFREGGVNETTLRFNPKEVSVDRLGEPETADGIMVWNGEPVSHGAVDDDGPSTLLGDALGDGGAGLTDLALPAQITSAVDVVDYISFSSDDDLAEPTDF